MDNTVIYHVARKGWDGKALKSFALIHEWSEATAELITANWPDVEGERLVEEYYASEALYIHCHATLDEAKRFASEFGGVILAIDAEGLRVGTGQEYPHPVVRDEISADRITRI